MMNNNAGRRRTKDEAVRVPRRFWGCLLAVLLCCSLGAEMPGTTVLAATQSDYATYEELRSGSAGGGGKPEEYITVEINGEADLEQLAESCRLDDWSVDKYVVLNQDITLQENSAVSIPSFSGIFDGGGHRITNLHILGDGSGQGLFRCLRLGGEIRNLNVEGQVAPGGSRSQVGGIVGINYGLLYNCTFSGNVEGDNEVGGIAGQNAGTGEIRKCSSHAEILGNHCAGGIAGSNYGTLNNCTNTGAINTYSTEVTYELDDFTMESFEDINSASNVAAHTDSGGIAGLSGGKIYYCSNSGTVGYAHVGYNSGGIVGRLSQGYLQNCTNTGHVLGRKDVGGIAGQMEPFLEIQYLNDKLSELDRELDYTIDLMAQLHGDISGYGKQASGLAENLTTNLKNVSSAATNLSNMGNDLWYIYNQELSGVANDIKILDNDLKDAQEQNSAQGGRDDDNGLTVTSGDIQDMVDGALDKIEGTENSGSDAGDIREDMKNHESQNSGGQAGNREDEAEAYKAALEKFGTNTGRHLDNMTSSTSDRTGGISNSLNVMDKEMQSAVDNLGKLTELLGTAGDKTSEDIDALLEQAKVLRRLLSDIRDELFSYEGITVRDNSDEAASGELTSLGAGEEPEQDGTSLPKDGEGQLKSGEGQPEDGEDQSTGGKGQPEGGEDQSTDGKGQPEGGKDQSKGVEGQQEGGEDQSKGVEGQQEGGEDQSTGGKGQSKAGEGQPKSGEDLAEDGAGMSEEEINGQAAMARQQQSAAQREEEDKLYDTTSFQKGKITLCLNKGRVEADTNVGGIVGQIATEFDFDPEDDITLTGKESFDIEKTIKAVVRESRNLGDITGKKDCVGGVAGKADFGAIISCESYGDVDSASGSNVGGIAGSSSYAVRSCYSMGKLDGRNNVGGIAGKGSDIFYSYAMNTISVSGEGMGAIAGKVAEDGKLFGNYYVNGEAGGIDGVGYMEGAAPLSYEQFSALENLPEAFTSFTITFQVDGKELASYTCRYGDSLTAEQIPEIPEREGYFGFWPEYDLNHITGNRILEAQYEKWTGSVASRETGESGKAFLLAEGRFLPEARLSMTRNGEEITFEIQYASGMKQDLPAGTESRYMAPVKVRVLCEKAPEDTIVEVKSPEGSFRPVEAEVMGSYLKFTMEQPGTFRMVQKEKGNSQVIMFVAAGAAAVVLLLLLLHGKKLLSRRKKEAEEEKRKKKERKGSGRKKGEKKGKKVSGEK